MENELRQFVNMNYGPQSWAQIVKLQAEIRVREQEARLQAEREREEAIERLCIWIGVISVVILFIFMIVVAYKVAASTMIIQSVTRGNITPWV
jgi:CHASE3 domain sensor protein